MKAGRLTITAGNVVLARRNWHTRQYRHMLLVLFISGTDMIFRYVFLILLGVCLSACQNLSGNAPDTRHQILISVPEQRMLLLEEGKVIGEYKISTAKRGIGDMPDSYMTPGGKMEIAQKIGDGLPAGSVMKDRVPTGEIVGPDAPGRDPVVTRILWLKGLEASNQNAYSRFIYIHGTPQESLLGQPASYGCIRMRSADIIDVFAKVGTGTIVRVEDLPIQRMLPE